MDSLVVFLGNPGKQYEQTRHNVAVRFAEHLSFYTELSWQNKFKGMFAQHQILHQTGSGKTAGRKIGFLIPETYMNKSGESVTAAASFFKIAPASIIIVHDDVETAFGNYEIKKGGGLAGHNGLRSIAGLLGTKDFHRLKIGISRPKHGPVSSYVLGKFTPEEEAELSDVLDGAAGLLEEFLEQQ